MTCVNAWHADRTGERYYHIVLPLILATAAFILAASSTAMAPRYVSMMLMVSYPQSLLLPKLNHGLAEGPLITHML